MSTPADDPVTEKPRIGYLVYWVKKNQVLRIGDGDVTIRLKDTAIGRAQLQIEVREGLQIATESVLTVSNDQKRTRL
jgi:hypothetical protein